MARISVGEALARGSGDLTPVSETPGRDVQVLLAEIMSRPREWLLAHPEAPIPPEVHEQLRSAIRRLTAGEPLPYVLGWWDFYGRRFALTPDVLIPRPETELLVEQGLEAIDRNPGPHKIFDLGTGSGCVGITLALERRAARVIATDLSWAALRVARGNAQRLGAANQVAFVVADLTSGLTLEDAIVLANLPYVEAGDASDLACEPRLALDGGAGGTDVIQRLLHQLACRRPSRTTVLLEIGAGQGSALSRLASELCRPTDIWLRPDLAGHDRVLGLEFQGATP